MRRILIERARRQRARSHGGGRRRIDLDRIDLPDDQDGAPIEDLLALDEALDRFAREAPAKAELVKLRFFAGLSLEEAAAVLGISRTSASRHWRFAKAWLLSELS
jgi:RNA polymerase sigma factor (TIGR02999 family)